jgi:hypothetical protein
MVGKLGGFLLAALSLVGKPSHANEISCATFLRDFSQTARGIFAYGYLEGVEGALTKEITDVLVPVSHPDHPLWWVVPKGGSSVRQFAFGLQEACEKHPSNNVLKAILNTALRKGGWPAFGAFIDPNTGKLTQPMDRPNKNVAGKATLKCDDYIKMREENRQAFVTGYFTGTEAFRLVMEELTKKPDPFYMAWPIGTSAVEMRQTTDVICTNPKGQWRGHPQKAPVRMSASCV